MSPPFKLIRFLPPITTYEGRVGDDVLLVSHHLWVNRPGMRTGESRNIGVERNDLIIFSAQEDRFLGHEIERFIIAANLGADRLGVKVKETGVPFAGVKFLAKYLCGALDVKRCHFQPPIAPGRTAVRELGLPAMDRAGTARRCLFLDCRIFIFERFIV